MAQSEVRQWIAGHNLVPPRGMDFHLITGYVLDTTDRAQWNKADGQMARYPVIVRAGSEFEARLPKWKIKDWQGAGAIHAPDDVRHYAELDNVFAHEARYMSEKTSLANILRAHNIFTLEAVVNDEPGTIPFSEASTDGEEKPPEPIKPSDLLRILTGDADMAADLIDDAKTYLAQLTKGDNHE